MVSPDGTRIAYTKATVETAFDIHVMNIDGSNNQNISHIEGQDQLPAWTPDSNQVVFSVDAILYRQSAIPNPPDRQVIRDNHGEGFDSPFFVSKSFKLVFRGPKGICTMNIDGTSVEQITTEIPEGYRLMMPCWSPDGSKLVFNKFIEGYHFSHLYLINVDGSGLSQVTFAEDVSDWSVSWSY